MLNSEKDPETEVQSMTLRRITAAIAAAFAFAGTAFTTALPASASVRPVDVYTQGMAGGWSGPAVRPASMMKVPQRAAKTRPVFASHRPTDQDGEPHGTISHEIERRRERAPSRRR